MKQQTIKYLQSCYGIEFETIVQLLHYYTTRRMVQMSGWEFRFINYIGTAVPMCNHYLQSIWHTLLNTLIPYIPHLALKCNETLIYTTKY